MTTTLERHLADPVATDAFAVALAGTAPTTAVVHLHGDLGAGKSSLARAWLRALGVTGPIPSPTYTLVERYAVPNGEALHLDLYRIGDVGELEFLGLDGEGARLWLIEWPERGAGAVPAPDLLIHLDIDGAGRRARLRATSSSGRSWLGRLAGGGLAGVGFS